MMRNHEHSSHTHRRRKGLGKIAVATLPAVLLAGLLTITGPAGAQGGSNGILMGETEPPPSGDSDGPRDIAPGESLSTVRGTSGNPVTRDDPFALELQNVSDQTLFAFIEEQVCDGNQPEPLCSQPRLGGMAGDFQFSGGGSVAAQVLELPAEPVVIAKLFYDRTLVRRANGLRMFLEKFFGGPIVRLPNCDDDGSGPTTECYSARKLGSGDQIVRVPLQFDPRITRG